MPPQIDSQRIPSLLAADVARTLGESLLPNVAEIAANAREVALEPDARTASEAQEFFDSKVVGDFQQFVHDEFIDVTWPACPLHQRHPLDFDHSHTAWRCPANGQLVTALGTLPS